MTILRRRWPILFLALVPLLVLWPAAFGGQAIGPWDHIRSMAPWNGPKPSTPWDVLQADGVLQFAPWRSLVFDAWSKGQIPAWNNYQLMGTPLLANSQSAGFYPLHILVGVLHIPLYPAMTFLAWFHLFWAGLGCYLLTRRMGGTKTGAAIAGASFSMSAFMVYWTALPSVIMTVSWIPWALASVMAVFQTDSMWELWARPRFQTTTSSPQEALSEAKNQVCSQYGWKAGVIGSVAMMVLAGHLQFAAFGLLAVALAVIVMAIRMFRQPTNDTIRIVRLRIGDPTSGEPVGAKKVALRSSTDAAVSCAFAIVIGLCIAAPQLLPVLQFSKQSHRRGVPTAEGYSSYVSGAIQPWELASLEFPKLLGDPAQSAGDPQNHSLFWAALVKRGDAFGESALAIGPLILLLLCLVPLTGWKRGTPVALVGVLGILIACATPIDYLLYFLVPGWSSTGSPGRAIVLFVMAACCLGGLALRPKEERHLQANVRGLIVYVAITIILALFIMFAFDGLQSFIPGLQLAPVIHQARDIDMPMIMIGGLLALAAGVWWLWSGGKSKIGLLLAASVVPVILSFGVLRFGTPIEPAEGPANFDRVAYVNAGWNLFVTPQANMPPNMATLLRQHDVAGYDSLLDKDTKALLDNANKQDSSPPENGNMMLIKPTADQNALADLGVSRVDRTYGATNLQGSRASSTGSTLLFPEFEREDYQSVLLKAIGPGVLTLKDRNMPGWSAKLDGKPTPIKAGPFRQIDLPAGTHEVEFRYWPPGLTAGLVLFLLGMVPFTVNLVGWLGTGRMGRRK